MGLPIQEHYPILNNNLFSLSALSAFEKQRKKSVAFVSAQLGALHLQIKAFMLLKKNENVIAKAKTPQKKSNLFP